MNTNLNIQKYCLCFNVICRKIITTAKSVSMYTKIQLYRVCGSSCMGFSGLAFPLLYRCQRDNWIMVKLAGRHVTTHHGFNGTKNATQSFVHSMAWAEKHFLSRIKLRKSAISRMYHSDTVLVSHLPEQLIKLSITPQCKLTKDVWNNDLICAYIFGISLNNYYMFYNC